MATFVLVHGAVVGSWCWRWVTPLLRSAGHEVYTPSLTGLGERVHLAGPDVTLDTHVTDVLNLLWCEDLTDVVLMGWSYGGMIVAGAADRAPERIGHLVYLDSDVPRHGETSAPPSQHAARIALANAHGDGWRVPPAATAAHALLLSDLPAAQRDWIAARFAPQPLRTWIEPIHLTGAAADVPTSYIRCTSGYDPNDEDMIRQDARIRSEPGWRYIELAEAHAIPFTAPRVLALALIEIAAQDRAISAR